MPDINSSGLHRPQVLGLSHLSRHQPLALTIKKIPLSGTAQYFRSLRIFNHVCMHKVPPSSVGKYKKKNNYAMPNINSPGPHRPQVPLSRPGLLLHPAGTPHLTCISDTWTVPPLRPPAPCTGNKKTNSPARHSTCSLTFLYHVSSGTETQCVIHGCGGWKKLMARGVLELKCHQELPMLAPRRDALRTYSTATRHTLARRNTAQK